MERKLIDMLDHIEVPESTARKAEELLVRELLNKSPKSIEKIEKTEKIEEEETCIKMKIKKKQSRWMKVMEASAAAIALAAGITAAVHVVHNDNGEAVSTTPTITAGQNKIASMDKGVLKSLEERNLYELKEGKNIIDLDLDGTAEEVVLKNIMTGTSVNEFEIIVGDQTIKGEVDRDEGLKLRAAMLMEKKDSIQLLFTSQYLSDDYITEVYCYTDKKLEKVGEFAEEVDNLKLKEDGSFVIVQPGGVLGRTKTTHISIIDNPSTDPLIPGKYYLQQEDEFESTIKYQYEVTALQNIKTYKSIYDTSSVAMEIKKGDVVRTIEIIEEQALCIENEKGERGYLEVHLDNIYIDGKQIPAWELFDGLPIAG